MPAYPSRYCSCRPDCPNRIERGQRYCLEGLKRAEQRRPNPWLRKLYHTLRWQKTREAQLQREPACYDCAAAGKLEPATDVHHKQKPRNETEFFDLGRLGSLCHSCHAKRTARGE